jgi:hypothetical protein
MDVDDKLGPTDSVVGYLSALPQKHRQALSAQRQYEVDLHQKGRFADN